MASKDGKRSYGVKLVRGPFLRLEPHELACDTVDEVLALAEVIEKPKAIDLFCGAGGMSLGLAEAGFEVILGVDHDDDALETHRAHHPGLSVNWDLGDESVVEDVADLARRAGVTLIAGGPPCQPFSRAGRSMIRDLVKSGRREHHDRRRDLWESFLGVVELAGPAAVLMENVPDMALDRGMVILRTMTERLEELGYSVHERVVDTWRYGVPQFRQRLILVALANGVEFQWPAESAERVTVANAIGDLPPVEGGWRPSNGDGPDPVASGWSAYGGPKTDFQRRARAEMVGIETKRVYDHITRPVREDDAVAFSQMTSETRYSDLDPELRRYRHDIFDDKYKRLDRDDLSRTITAHIAKDGYWYIHPDQDRTLTVREAARLQTFPDHIRFAGPPSAAFRQIGNAVPVELGRHIGAGILESLADPRRTRISTHLVAEELAAWFGEDEPRHLPWLAADNRWQVIQAEILWGRIADAQASRGWASVRQLRTPEETLAAIGGLRRMAALLKREHRCEQLEETAEWLTPRSELLDTATTAQELSHAPNVTSAIADLACRVVPGETEDPVLASLGVLRVAARFTGLPVDRQNRLSDGRLAVARMIGGRDVSHEAHLALIEIAAGVCTPAAPECARCPLQGWCVEAAARGWPAQQVIPFTSRA